MVQGWAAAGALQAVRVEEGEALVVSMPPDGECLYTAMAHQLQQCGLIGHMFDAVGGPDHMSLAARLRSQAADFMAANTDLYLQPAVGLVLDEPGRYARLIVAGGVPEPEAALAAVIDGVRRPVREGGAWGNNAALSALASAFNVVIRVHNEVDGRCPPAPATDIAPEKRGRPPPLATLLLAYRLSLGPRGDGPRPRVDRVHYDSVVRLQAPTQPGVAGRHGKFAIFGDALPACV